MAHLYLAATQKSSGKTTLSIGLIRELSRRGQRVQPFKKGPDYIDPLWLARAAGGRTCHNLDYHSMPVDEIRSDFKRLLEASTIGLIEGNVGLFDSPSLDGAGSNAELAKLLGAPVLLVINVQGMGRGIVPLLLGYQAFDPDLQIAGVILNKVGGGRHEANLRRVVEHYTDLPLLGSIPRDAELAIEERHLGLIPSNEAEAVEATVESIRRAVADCVDVDQILSIAEDAPTPDWEVMRPAWPEQRARSGSSVRIGIARDEVFGFYYPDDLAGLERAGAELVPFSPLADASLPAVDGLILGGGFPESRMQELEANRSMRQSIADFIANGGVTYAECGGLMYLCERLHWGDDSRQMCAVLDADVAMHARPQGRGYVRLRETEAFPWPRVPADVSEICAHEFHHSAIVAPRAEWRYAFDVLRGTGIDGAHDGIIQRNLLASYAHLRDVGGVNWTRRFVDRVRAVL
ncbi:MAG: hydrogenobyrinic acid a,c-diamide synthase (glutamine-hydrolyzing) [Chromatiaceae bacterium]|nr:hydrogenobyrinic acid a,c-diamide synthase (glutamine-hydrolyzing) [Chromatiaceae bacterium]MCF7994092.1 hydrogenobyrinic acid a,c-diamide synthase (glutamine-hydrolyzing) [Chromatiaceae bacterium]